VLACWLAADPLVLLPRRVLLELAMVALSVVVRAVEPSTSWSWNQ